MNEFANQLNDDSGTGINTACHQSRFYWNHKQFSWTLKHPSSNLPEMCINDGFRLSALCSRIVGQQVDLCKHHCHCAAASSFPNKDGSAVIPMVTQEEEFATEMFHIGETLLYLNAGHTIFTKLNEIFLGDNNVLFNFDLQQLMEMKSLLKSKINGLQKLKILDEFLLWSQISSMPLS